MRKRVKWFIAVLSAIVVLGASAWRLWPHPFWDMVPAGGRSVTSLACTAGVSGLHEDGTAFVDAYQLQALSGGSEACEAVLGVLDQSDYRESFQNLLPWSVTSVSTGGEKNASIFLAWGSTERESCFLTVHSDGSVVVSTVEEEGLLVFHAADRTVLDKLIDYVRLHGTKIDIG